MSDSIESSVSARYTGVGVSPGRVVGPVLTMTEPLPVPVAAPRDTSLDDEAAEAALAAASATVAEALRARASVASGDAKGVLEATAMMATDPMLLKAAKKSIASGKTPERAYYEAASEVAAMFAQLGGQTAERQRDVEDVRDRVIAELWGVDPPGIPHSETPFILVAEDLSPADTATLNPAKVLGLVTAKGGPQSHTAIIARSLGLPAVVAAEGVGALEDSAEIHVDASTGLISTEITEKLRAEAEAFRERLSRIPSFSGLGRLADGTKLPLLANVGNAEEARTAVSANAQGVGLFRTEFLFLARDDEPDKAQQVTAYREIFETLAERGTAKQPAKVVVRTLDAGADKPLPFLNEAAEPNPALGVRGFRTELAVPGVLARQLEAVAEAAQAFQEAPGSEAAEVWVMAPMISTADEAAHFRELAEQAGLIDTGCRIGVMVEVPAAALSIGPITDEVDFVSIGTNDLTQYTMASDRQVGSLSSLNDSWQPAVLQLIRTTAEGSSGPVGVCGEAAADPALAVVLVGLGVDTLSMSPAALDVVAAVLATVTLQQARQLAETAVTAPNASEARAAVVTRLPLLAELGLG